VALPHAILVSLCEQAGSGYELANRFDRSIGYFWAATHQQIHRTLKTMEEDGWVSVTPVAQQGRPGKKVYAVSDAGRAELARWIAEPLSGRGSSVADNRTRDIAVKIRGAEHGDIDTVRAQVAALRVGARRIAEHLPGIREAPVPRPGPQQLTHSGVGAPAPPKNCVFGHWGSPLNGCVNFFELARHRGNEFGLRSVCFIEGVGKADTLR
jgi:DNA-binding PadR family transcriptional regulator